MEVHVAIILTHLNVEHVLGVYSTEEKARRAMEENGYKGYTVKRDLNDE